MHIFEVTKVVVVVVGSWPPKIFSVCHCSNANRCLSKNQINCWSQVGRKIWFFCEFFHLLKRDKLENAVCAVLFVVRKLLGEGSRSRTDEKWLVFTSNVPNRGSNPPKKTFPRSLKTNRVFIYHLFSWILTACNRDLAFQNRSYWDRSVLSWLRPKSLSSSQLILCQLARWRGYKTNQWISGHYKLCITYEIWFCKECFF
jgi:hypothetical protein